MTNLTSGQMIKILETARELGATPVSTQRAIGSGIIAAALNPEASFDNMPAILKLLGLDACLSVDRRQKGTTLTVNYDISLGTMIAAGNYDWVDDNIIGKHFPISENGKAEVLVELVHFDRTISTDDATLELARRGLRPATLAELLAYGAKFPEDQRKFPIVALGTGAVMGGKRHVAVLYRFGVKRYLSLGWAGSDWDDFCRFLAVRNLAL